MAEIIKGTTPTIKFTFSNIEVADLAKAIMTVKKNGEIKIEHDLAAATVDENTISWTLSQAETLAVAGNAEIMLNWLTDEGTRGASNATQVTFTPNHKEVEI